MVQPVINEDLSEFFLSHCSRFWTFVKFAAESLVRISDRVTDRRSLRVTRSPGTEGSGQMQGLLQQVGQCEKLLPADGIPYEARDATATSGSLSLITGDLTPHSRVHFLAC